MDWAFINPTYRHQKRQHDYLEQLEQLARLKADGVLSDDEFAREKATVLGQHSTEATGAERRPMRLVLIAGLVIVGLIAAGAWIWLGSRAERPVQAERSVVANEQSVAPEQSTPTPTPSIVAAPPTSDAASPQMHEGRCHTGECSWSKELKRETVGAGPSGRLIRLNLLGGSSDDHGSAIEWDREAHDVYVFCSLRLPTVLIPSDRGWQVDVLDFGRGVPGRLESSEGLYGDTCHPGDEQFPSNTNALGYDAIPEERTEVTISKPQDIFDRADF
jgi:hypothetical protein